MFSFKKTGNENGTWCDSNLGPLDQEVMPLIIAPNNLAWGMNLRYNYTFVKKNISRVIRRSSDCVEQIKRSTTLQRTLVPSVVGECHLSEWLKQYAQTTLLADEKLNHIRSWPQMAEQFLNKRKTIWFRLLFKRIFVVYFLSPHSAKCRAGASRTRFSGLSFCWIVVIVVLILFFRECSKVNRKSKIAIILQIQTKDLDNNTTCTELLKFLNRPNLNWIVQNLS